MSAVGDLIDAMSLVRKREEEDTMEDLFPVSKIPNPEFQRLFQVRKAGSAIVVLFSFLSFSFSRPPSLLLFLFEMAGLELNT